MKLYVGNLPWSVRDKELKEAFAEYNPSEANVIINRFNDRSKGFGFVTIDDDAAAAKAVEEMNGKEVDGRALTVNEARPMRDDDRQDSHDDDSGSSEAPMADSDAANESTEDSIEEEASDDSSDDSTEEAPAESAEEESVEEKSE